MYCVCPPFPSLFPFPAGNENPVIVQDDNGISYVSGATGLLLGSEFSENPLQSPI